MKKTLISVLALIPLLLTLRTGFAIENGPEESVGVPSAMHARGPESGPSNGPQPGWGPQPGNGSTPAPVSAPGNGPHPGWGPAPGYGPHPGWGPAPGYGPHPGWGNHPGWGGGPAYGPGPGWHTNPFPVHWGYNHWQRWNHPHFERPAFEFEWHRLSSVTCAAQDSYGNAYPITVNEFYGWAYRERMEQIEDLALDRCFQESGGNPYCSLEGCWPGY